MYVLHNRERQPSKEPLMHEFGEHPQRLKTWPTKDLLIYESRSRSNECANYRFYCDSVCTGDRWQCGVAMHVAAKFVVGLLSTWRLTRRYMLIDDVA